MAAARSRFEGGHRKDFADEIRIPTTGERYWLRETRAPLGHVAVQYFIMKDRGDAQPTVFNEPLLDCIGEDGSLTRTLSFSLSRNLPDSVFHDQARFLGREIPAVIRKIRLRAHQRSFGPETG